ncbi:M20/M25/M40 family metallo-hydrolase [Pontibacter qinzhouensis]|uniref:M20/M25/M40 family metallo-hydrolase n=1 Tax=Pontibacter qinzhouensis TaxID=2603253 RepID=A0A5C8KCH1_9BACT|nr:M20/M25/M40 family metallo-hydrolase [Pontibacter qinzhouensis]TXK51911.1 M20/M25/M40 family metallo-hydrolase [Pontibacter qinzhouensis]
MKKHLAPFPLLLLFLLTFCCPYRVSATVACAAPDSLMAEAKGSRYREAVQKLSGAIKFKTISDTEDKNTFADEFIALHDYLENAFKELHSRLTREIINKQSLLYTWPGTDPELKPVLLSAHIDVVPVEAVSMDEWEQEAFSGIITNGHIWGRGALDDKYRVIAIMEAVEQLLLNGYMPERTILLAFGHDEEIGGNEGAGAISELLQERYQQLEAVFDEGLAVTKGIFPGIEEPIAFIGTASKGSANFRLTVKGDGGHSSIPPNETPISILSQAIVNINNNPFKAHITPSTKETLEILSNRLGGKSKFAMQHFGLFKGTIKKQLSKNMATDALIRTKASPTIIQAGEKENVLPRVAQAIVNVRLLTGETEESARAHLVKAISDERVEVAGYGTYSPPSAVAKTDTWVYQALKNTIETLFPEALVVPALFPGGTDARHYASLTDNIFRFAPQLVTPDDATRVHNVNERIALSVFDGCIDFYNLLIRQVADQEEYFVQIVNPGNF